MSLLQNAITLLLLGKDDDGEWVYNKIPEWQRHNSIILPIVTEGLPDWVKTSFGLKNIETGNSKFLAFTWRVPYVYNIIHVTGVSIIEALTKNNPEGLKSAAMNVATAMATTSFTGLNPLGSETINLSSFAPTIAKPLVEVALNEGFYGKIHPEVFPTDKRPPSVVMTQSVRDEARLFAEFVNEMTGGTEAKAGWLSPYPDDIQYLEDQVLGGLGKTLLNMVQSINNLSSGRKVEFHRIPLLRTMFMLERPTFTSQRYYEIKEELEALKGEYTQTGNLVAEEASDAAKERWVILQQEMESGRLTLLPVFQEYEKALNEAYEELRAARKREDYDRVDEIQEYILERQIEFIGRYNTLTEKR